MTSVLGLGTATPAHEMTQQEALRMFSDIVCQDERQLRLARALFRKSAVHTRQTVVPHRVAYDWCQSVEGSQELPIERDLAVPGPLLPSVRPGESKGPTTRERMALYARFASDLAAQASDEALTAAQLHPRDITHLIVVTCTGFAAPGVDFDLIRRLELRRTTQRIQVGFMGCHGAINGLRAALAITQANPHARVLLCAVELCSLHYRSTWDPDGVVGNALFADGAAALLLGHPLGTVDAPGAPPWRLLDTGSVLIPDSQDAMSWKIGDHGFEMRLSSEVGEKIEAHLADWLGAWLAEHELAMHDITHWGVHPGGPRILQAVQCCLGLHEDTLQTSRAILERHGNMSSPTVLFILREFHRQLETAKQKRAGYALLLGFGPGLAAEVALLACHAASR